MLLSLFVAHKFWTNVLVLFIWHEIKGPHDVVLEHLFVEPILVDEVWHKNEPRLPVAVTKLEAFLHVVLTIRRIGDHDIMLWNPFGLLHLVEILTLIVDVCESQFA